MNRFMRDGETTAMSPVHDEVSAAAMRAGPPCDAPCRRESQAPRLRRARLEALSRWVEGLHRGPFTGTI